MFKDEIKELRLSNHLTQEQFAEKIFVSRSAVAKWEQGRGIPKYDTIKDIATTFDIAIDDLYKQDEVHEVINVIEKDNKKKIIVLLSIISILLACLITSLSFSLSKKEFKPYSEYNAFINEDVLDDLSLINFPIINNSDSKTNYSGENIISYYTNITGEEDFDNYAKSILTYLLSSPYIAYVGYDSQLLIDHSVLIYDETYLLTSNEIDKYITPYYYDSFYGNKKTIYDKTYHFYFLDSLSSRHKRGDKINVSRISLSYGIYTGQLFVDESKESYNFNLNITKNCYGDFYFFDEFFEIKTIQINKDNFNDYFTFRVDPSKIVNYAIVTNYIFYDAYVEVEAYLGDENRNTTATTYIRSSNIGGGFDVDELYGYYDNEKEEIIYPYSLTIKEGYISFAMPK